MVGPKIGATNIGVPNNCKQMTMTQKLRSMFGILHFSRQVIPIKFQVVHTIKIIQNKLFLKNGSIKPGEITKLPYVISKQKSKQTAHIFPSVILKMLFNS
jgi:hypothetical protein